MKLKDLNPRINQFIKFLNRIPKNCILCESWVRFKAPLCKPCRRYLFQESLKSEFHILNIENHPCYYLWDWNSMNHEWIQKIIISMKDGDHFELYRVFMPWLLKKISAYSTEHFTYVVAIPSADRLHPEALIRSYTHYQTQSEVLIVDKNVQRVQKYKTKNERQETSFKLRHENQYLDSNQSLWVLDDVLATGGSFRGILKLFCNHPINGVLVWAYKSKR